MLGLRLRRHPESLLDAAHRQPDRQRRRARRPALPVGGEQMPDYPRPPATQLLPRPPTEAVWVRLDAVYPHPPDARQTSVPDSWDLVGTVPGVLQSRSWIRSARGMWLAVCTYRLPSADGRRTTDPLPGGTTRSRICTSPSPGAILMGEYAERSVTIASVDEDTDRYRGAEFATRHAACEGVVFAGWRRRTSMNMTSSPSCQLPYQPSDRLGDSWPVGRSSPGQDDQRGCAGARPGSHMLWSTVQTPFR
jgi:hypothetical protein